MIHCFKIFNMHDIVVEAIKKLADSKPEWILQFTIVPTKTRNGFMYFLLTNDDVKDKKQMIAKLNLNASYRIEHLF